MWIANGGSLIITLAVPLSIYYENLKVPHITDIKINDTELNITTSDRFQKRIYVLITNKQNVYSSTL